MKHFELIITTYAQEELRRSYLIENNELTEVLEDAEEVIQHRLGQWVRVEMKVVGHEFSFEFVPVETMGNDDYIVTLETTILELEEKLCAYDDLEKSQEKKEAEDMNLNNLIYNYLAGDNNGNLEEKDINNLINHYFEEFDTYHLTVKGVESYMCSDGFADLPPHYWEKEEEYSYAPMYRWGWKVKNINNNRLLTCAVQAGFDVYEVITYDHADNIVDNFYYLGLNSMGYDFYAKHWRPMFTKYLQAGPVVAFK